MSIKLNSICCSLYVLAVLSLACKKNDTIADDDAPTANHVIPASEAALFKIDLNYYKKYIMLGSTLEASIPIFSGPRVSDEALEMAKITCSVLTNTLPNPVLEMLRQQRIHVVIFGNTEYPNVIPTWNPAWDAKRYGGGYGPNAPGANCGIHEGDILNNPFDRYPTENIVVHEFAHAVMDFGLSKIYPDFRTRLVTIYNNAKTKNLWQNTYAITNVSEYWAEGIQSYFNLNATGTINGDGVHNQISTRAKLKDYDPDFYAFIREFYGDATMPSSVK